MNTNNSEPKIKYFSGKAAPTQIVGNISPYGFYIFGKEFHTASKAIVTGDGASPVRLYLLGHALELFLKSYLLIHGFSKKVLRGKMYGHNLHALMRESYSKEIGKTVQIEEGIDVELRGFNNFYQSKHLEYFTIATLFVPHNSIPVSKVERLVQNLETNLEDKV